MIAITEVLVWSTALFCLLIGTGNLMVNRILGVYHWDPIILIGGGCLVGTVYVCLKNRLKTGEAKNG